MIIELEGKSGWLRHVLQEHMQLLAQVAAMFDKQAFMKHISVVTDSG